VQHFASSHDRSRARRLREVSQDRQLPEHDFRFGKIGDDVGSAPPSMVPTFRVLRPSKASSGSGIREFGRTSSRVWMRNGELGIGRVREFPCAVLIIAQRAFRSESQPVLGGSPLMRNEPRGVAAAAFAPALSLSSPTTKSTPKL